MARKNIQVRIDEKLKRKVENVFAKIGIDTPTAVRMFFLKVAAVGGIPFPVVTDEDNYTAQQLAYIDRLAKEAKSGKNLSRVYTDVEDMIKDLHSQT